MNVTDMNQLKTNYKRETMTKEQVMQMKKTMENAKKETRKTTTRTNGIIKFSVPFAAAIALFIAVPNISMQAAETLGDLPIIGRLVEAVTFRDYKVDEERQYADVEVPEVVINESNAGDALAKEEVDPEVSEKLTKSAEEINAEIEAITEPFIETFEANMEAEGYQNIVIKHETIHSTDRYFTLKLICYQAAGSGAEWNYYYTIDLSTGERLELKDLFVDGADYITPISESIKTQMEEQMAADENVCYWLDDPEIPDEWKFSKITDETAFYVNDNGQLVISFNEGDVAPMYMGVVTFEIPAEVLEGILK